MKLGMGWNLSYLKVDWNPCEFYLMFLNREMDKKKTVSNLYKNVIQTETRDNITALPLAGVNFA